MLSHRSDASGKAIVFEMRGSAELDVVCEALGLQLDELTLTQYSTIGGFICAEAGEIPKAGDTIVLKEYPYRYNMI